jgi:hypothetical protein
VFKTIKDLFVPKQRPYALPSATTGPGTLPTQSCPAQVGCLTQWFGPKLQDYNIPPPPPRPIPYAAAGPATASTAPQAAAMNGDGLPDATFRAFTFNPAFEPKHRKAEAKEHEHREELHAVTHDAEPVVFVVPPGCDALDLLYGPIEINPDVGDDDDLAAAVSIGKAKLQASTCDLSRLRAGDEVAVVVPWRGHARLDLDAKHLRAEVIAHFYRSQQT